MCGKFIERRNASRYDTKVDIYFRIEYDLKTKVEYQVVDKNLSEKSEKYSAISKNVSSCGLCITSNKKLDGGEHLAIEVYLPDSQEPIKMAGEVKWSRENPANSSEENFDTGIKINSVEGANVKNTVYFDEIYQVEWSILLEKILGNFKTIANSWRKNS